MTAEGIVDACCLINLFATGEVEGFFKASKTSWYLPRAVVQEALFVRNLNPDGEEEKQPIDLPKLVQSGLISAVDVTGDNETESYVQLASELDDGEAMALAIASQRKWMLATDDRKARRLARDLNVAVITTPELVRSWTMAEKMTQAAVAALLGAIESRARFRPRQGAPDYDWWMSFMGNSYK